MPVMSNPLSIQSSLPAPEPAPVRSGVARPAQIAAPATKAAKLYVNPEYQFDPTVGLVVIEFHDTAGNLTNSFPSQRQLEAYRMHQQTPPGEETLDGTPAAG